MPPVAAVVSGIGSLVGSAASGVAGLAGAASSAVGGLAGATVTGLGGLASGAGSLLFGTPAAGMTEGQLMAAQAVPSYYETAGGVLGALPAAASKTFDYLGNIVPAVGGIYQFLKQPEALIPLAAQTMPVQAPVPVQAPAPAPAPLPILSQQPKVMTVGVPEKPKEVNYMLLIGLAVLALFLLRKK